MKNKINLHLDQELLDLDQINALPDVPYSNKMPYEEYCKLSKRPEILKAIAPLAKHFEFYQFDYRKITLPDDGIRWAILMYDNDYFYIYIDHGNSTQGILVDLFVLFMAERSYGSLNAAGKKAMQTNSKSIWGKVFQLYPEQGKTDVQEK